MSERRGQPMWPEELLLKLESPTPGIAHPIWLPTRLGGNVYLSLRAFLFGEAAPAAAECAEPAWRAWLDERLSVLQAY
jgi:hypothetical protein